MFSCIFCVISPNLFQYLHYFFFLVFMLFLCIYFVPYLYIILYLLYYIYIYIIYFRTIFLIVLLLLFTEFATDYFSFHASKMYWIVLNFRRRGRKRSRNRGGGGRVKRPSEWERERVSWCLSFSVRWIMAPRRMETKPVILCLKTVLLLYSFIFWVRKLFYYFKSCFIYFHKFIKTFELDLLQMKRLSRNCNCYIYPVFNYAVVTFKQSVSSH